MRSPLRKIIFGILLLTLVIGSAFSASAAKAKKKVKLSVKKVTLTVGDKYTVKLKNAKSKVKWKVKSKKIASIKSKGKAKVVITAKKTGTTKVYGTYKGKKYMCTVIVVAKQTSGGGSSSSSSSSSWSSGDSGGLSSGGSGSGSTVAPPVPSLAPYVDEAGNFIPSKCSKMILTEGDKQQGILGGWNVGDHKVVFQILHDFSYDQTTHTVTCSRLPNEIFLFDIDGSGNKTKIPNLHYELEIHGVQAFGGSVDGYDGFAESFNAHAIASFSADFGSICLHDVPTLTSVSFGDVSTIRGLASISFSLKIASGS